jgi:hypothetical protein
MTAYKETVARAETKPIRRQVKHSIRYYRNLLQQMESRPDATARFVFEPSTTERSARQLEVMLEGFYDRGLMDAEALNPYARGVFGPDFPKLNANPVPPAQRDQLELQGAQAKNEEKLTHIKADTDEKLTHIKADAYVQKAKETAKIKAKEKGPPAKKARKK